MLKELQTAWQARRVLIVGGAGRLVLFMQAMLDELGAKPARLAPLADSETIFRALSEGRISTVIAFQPDAFAPAGSAAAQLSALSTLLGEMREAGVPLFILCSDAAACRRAAYTTSGRSLPIAETARSFSQSLLERYADGVSRGLDGDAVRALLLRHAPALGCGHPAVSAYSDWCHALDLGAQLHVPNPDAQGIFMHPLDICCGALLLGARFFLHDSSCTGVFNLGADPSCRMNNRRAALRFLAANGGVRPILEESQTVGLFPSAPSGARARLLAGVRCLIRAEEALALLLSLERAAQHSFTAEQTEILQQTHRYLNAMQ